MREFLDYALRSYDARGIRELEPWKIAYLLRIRYGSTDDAQWMLGPVPAIRTAFIDIQGHPACRGRRGLR